MIDSKDTDDGTMEFNLRLYVCRPNARSRSLQSQTSNGYATRIWRGRYKIEVIDLVVRLTVGGRRPNRGDTDTRPSIAAALKRMIGDLSNSEKVIVGLDLRPVRRSPR